MITVLGDHIGHILGFVILLNLKHLTQEMTGISQECIRAPSKRGRYWEIHPRCRCRAGKKLEILNVTPPIKTLPQCNGEHSRLKIVLK